MAEISVRDVSLSYGTVTALGKMNLDVHHGEFLVLLGPSGCGKSTLLNAIAGLADVSAGQIWIGGRNVTWEEPKDRGVGMVFQSYALYPRMTVYANMAFALKVARLPKAEVERRVRQAAEWLQIDGLLQRHPHALSGGQRQRVAIGRALVRQVDTYLLDEPLSNLDAQLRDELRHEIKRLHRSLGCTMVYVTHDQIEALTLADRVAVMRGGKIEQLDAPLNVYERPASRFIAGFLGSPGMNFLDGTIDLADGPRFAFGALSVPLSHYDFTHPPQPGRPTILGIRPEQASLGGADNEFMADAVVDLVEPMGAETLVWCNLAGQRVAATAEARAPYATGEHVRISFGSAALSLFDADSGERM